MTFVANFAQVGPLAIWIEMLPCAMGVGVAMVILSLIVAIYYNVIMAYCLHYLFNSMRYCDCTGKLLEGVRISSVQV